MTGFTHTDSVKAKIAAAHRGRPNTAEHNKAIRAGWKLRLANGGETPHGSPSKYKYGCRCDECREAWRLYKRELRARRQRA